MPDKSIASGPVAVFGGTGFLGRRIVRRLLDDGRPVRVAVRAPSKAVALFGEAVDAVAADVTRPGTLIPALDGARSAVNAVSLYVEKGDATFERVHVEGARALAEAAQRAGIRLVHLSGIGSHPDDPDSYIRARGRGEVAVRAAHPAAVILRSAVMVAPDDAFLTSLVRLLRTAPVYPLFGRGESQLQPVVVDDVAAAVCALSAADAPAAPLYETAGPSACSYADLVRTVAGLVGVHPRLVPVPWALWCAAAAVAGLLPRPPLTDSQIALVRRGNAADPRSPGLAALGIAPSPIAPVVREILEGG